MSARADILAELDVLLEDWVKLHKKGDKHEFANVATKAALLLRDHYATQVANSAEELGVERFINEHATVWELLTGLHHKLRDVLRTVEDPRQIIVMAGAIQALLACEQALTSLAPDAEPDFEEADDA